MEKRKVYLWLKSITSISDIIIENMESQVENIEQIFYMEDKEILNFKNINTNILKNVVKYKSLTYIEEIIEKLIKLNIDYVSIDDKNYPKNLKHIYRPPKILYYKGNIKIVNEKLSIAMVGSRKCTQYGSNYAKVMGKKLSDNNINIVSGLALGIDSYSHRGCIDGKSNAIAVLGSGVDNVLPKSNIKLGEKILENGGVIISEFKEGSTVYPSNFVQRNRIISGISDGVFVVEAAKKSGALITVDYALEQGKNVFSLPGNINSIMSQGCNNIINQGAKLVSDIEDILEEYNIEYINDNNQKFENIDEYGKIIINSIKNKGILNIDEICDNTKIDIKNVNSIISELILKNLIIENENNKYSLNI